MCVYTELAVSCDAATRAVSILLTLKKATDVYVTLVTDEMGTLAQF